MALGYAPRASRSLALSASWPPSPAPATPRTPRWQPRPRPRRACTRYHAAMTPVMNHPWTLSTDEVRALQRALAGRVETRDRLGAVRRAPGVERGRYAELRDDGEVIGSV